MCVCVFVCLCVSAEILGVPAILPQNSGFKILAFSPFFTIFAAAMKQLLLLVPLMMAPALAACEEPEPDEPQPREATVSHTSSSDGGGWGDDVVITLDIEE